MRSILFSLLLTSSLFAQEVPPPFEAKPPAAPSASADTGSGEGDDQEIDPFDPSGDAPRMVHVQIEWIDVPHEVVTDLLLYHPLKTAAATELRLEVQKLVKAGTAKVLETQMIAARSGEKATAESIAEYIFPTEYEALKGVQPSTGEAKVAAGVKPSVVAWPPLPTSFETRNLGTTFEIEPTLGPDNRLIDLRFAPQLVWQTGRTVWQEQKDEKGNVAKIELPEIYSLRLTASLAMRSGVHSLAGILSPKDQNGRTDTSRKVMVFVKADSLAVP